jgi:hypothetical protein
VVCGWAKTAQVLLSAVPLCGISIELAFIANAANAPCWHIEMKIENWNKRTSCGQNILTINYGPRRLARGIDGRHPPETVLRRLRQPSSPGVSSLVCHLWALRIFTLLMQRHVATQIYFSRCSWSEEQPPLWCFFRKSGGVCRAARSLSDTTLPLTWCNDRHCQNYRCPDITARRCRPGVPRSSGSGDSLPSFPLWSP